MVVARVGSRSGSVGVGNLFFSKPSQFLHTNALVADKHLRRLFELLQVGGIITEKVAQLIARSDEKRRGQQQFQIAECLHLCHPRLVGSSLIVEQSDELQFVERGSLGFKLGQLFFRGLRTNSGARTHQLHQSSLILTCGLR